MRVKRWKEGPGDRIQVRMSGVECARWADRWPNSGLKGAQFFAVLFTPHGEIVRVSEERLGGRNDESEALYATMRQKIGPEFAPASK